MKNILFCFLFLFCGIVSGQTSEAFQDGEWLKFRIHYGWFNASFATLKVQEKNFRNKPVYHVVGHGESTGLLDVFFEVDDTYETYINQETNLPMRFIRIINEGGYEKNNRIDFDQANNKAVVYNRIKNTTKVYEIKNRVQDMLSAFYFLRNKIDDHDLQKGDKITINMFFDNENYKFVTKFLGRDIVHSEFGKIACLKFRPYVQAGRVFKEKESLTFWISADKNHIPIKIKADLAVGSLEADLDAFSGLKHPFEIIVD